mmetsp:Transcript_57878/g.105776  ORF Transcript_57878/g.105776 Transcript_57878/m.105776 type:complete len:123 (-) Transcript_57878:86-454(-)
MRRSGLGRQCLQELYIRSARQSTQDHDHNNNGSRNRAFGRFMVAERIAPCSQALQRRDFWFAFLKSAANIDRGTSNPGYLDLRSDSINWRAAAVVSMASDCQDWDWLGNVFKHRIRRNTGCN